MRWFVVVALSGCLLLPEKHESTQRLGVYTSSLTAGRAGALQLHVTESYATVHVTATRARHCFRELRERVEHRTDMSAHLAVASAGGSDSIGFVVAILTAPVFAASVLVTAAVIATSRPKREQHDERIEVTTSACPVIGAGIDLDVVLPSGATLHGTTDERGALSLSIPASEPAQGVAIVRSNEGEISIPYSHDASFAPPSVSAVTSPPIDREQSTAEQRDALQQRGFAAVRDALRSCGTMHGLHGVVATQLAIDRDGRVRASPDQGGLDFAACVNDALAPARFPAGHAQHLVFPYQI